MSLTVGAGPAGGHPAGCRLHGAAGCTPRPPGSRIDLTARKQAQLELTGGEQYRQLAEEYRRLSDLAVTAQEHTDLKLGEVSAQLDYLREQTASLQKILKDVE